MKYPNIARIFIVIALIFSFTNMNVYAGILDGKLFSGTTEKMGKKSSEKDEIKWLKGSMME